MATIFKCFKHGYEVDEPEKWHEHLATESHTVRGRSLCNNCDIPMEIKFTGKQGKKTPALCKDCATAILEGAKQALVEEHDD